VVSKENYFPYRTRDINPEPIYFLQLTGNQMLLIDLSDFFTEKMPHFAEKKVFIISVKNLSTKISLS